MFSTAKQVQSLSTAALRYAHELVQPPVVARRGPVVRVSASSDGMLGFCASWSISALGVGLVRCCYGRWHVRFGAAAISHRLVTV